MDGLRPGWAVKAIVVIILTSILFRCVSATNHSVGGSAGWDLASDLRAWSAATTFHVGDSLVFTYTPLHDVLEVDESDFELCLISHPISAHRDGNTVIPLSQTGARYFICGRLGHCDMGLKLQLQVLPQLTTNATDAGSNDDDGNSGSGDDGDGETGQHHGGGGGGGGGHGRRYPPPPPPHSHGSQPPPPNVKPDPVVDQPSAHVPPPAPSPCKASGACHVEELNWWCLPLITLLLIISSRPRETLCFLFTSLHLAI
ncbi:blue copper protein-like [Corylus avellana]|uniref:blue copper protein-like n=1 Tax=Corylus avellana TaxID=13451 RepID=UPI00286ADFE5|nr:blue copper protein-like [Corylus avellana]